MRVGTRCWKRGSKCCGRCADLLWGAGGGKRGRRGSRQGSACGTTSGLMSTTQLLERIGIPAYERFLLFAAPILELSLTPPCSAVGRMALNVHGNHWTSTGSVAAGTRVMRAHTRDYVPGLPDIQRSVGAAEDVDGRHETTMPSSVGFGKGEAPLNRGKPLDSPLDSRFALARGSLGAPLDLTEAARHERACRLAGGGPVRRVEWCERRDSNSHALASASPSSWCVCQFRHFRSKRLTPNS